MEWLWKYRSNGKCNKTGVDGAGVPCDLYFVSDFDVASINDYDGLILGCPAMGAEVLEECEFQPVLMK